MVRTQVEAAVRELLQALGEDPDREGLRETPRRVAGYWEELLEGERYSNERIARMFGKVFEVDTPTMVSKTITDVYSHCEHHLALMYNMTVKVAYLPAKNEHGKYLVLGLSKIPRIVKMCAKRLQLQERLTNDIAECIQIATGTKDIYVRITADHACVSARGAQAEGETTTYFTGGAFEGNQELIGLAEK